MRWYSLFFVCAFALALVASVAFAQETSLKIASPADGTVIKGDTCTIEYAFEKGSQGDHLHIYVDGKRAKVYRGNSPVELKDLPKGAREIEVRVAAKAHEEFGPKAKVNVTVE